MTGLLVSVRSAAEAEAALAGGACVIDVKEPRRGALGAADPRTWHEVCEIVASRVPVSAALGELFQADDGGRSIYALAAQTAGLAFAKIGLAGAASIRNWPARWRAALACLPPSVAAVAVAYADWSLAEAPPPEAVIDHGTRCGCQLVLFDTFSKSRGHLLDHLPPSKLHRLSLRAQQHGMQVVLAGSLTMALIPQILPLSPALVAVRGAACRGDRRGDIDALLVGELAAALSTDRSTIVCASSRLAQGA